MGKKLEKAKMDGLFLIPVGGCSKIGMNLYAYIFNDQWILVDMGMGFDNSLGRDVLVPLPEILVKNKSKIKALFITHSHEDHVGAIPYLWPMIECPIYGMPFAIEMIRDKLSQFGLANEVPLIKALLKSKINIGDFSVEFISVAHSTPESSAIAITTPDGIVLHSGDWRIDEEPVLGTKTDEERIKEYGDIGVSALVCDSTNVFKNGMYCSEKDVRENLINLVKQFSKNRVFVTCFASNLARLESCYMAAKATGRQLVIAGRSLKRIERIAKLSGYLTKLQAFLDIKKAVSLNPEKALIVCTGSQGERSSALNQMACGTHKNAKLEKDDVVIFSSRIIPGNEISVADMQNQLICKGIKIITDMDCEIHASGHPSKEEIRRLYSLCRPNAVIPVHGEKLQLYKHADIAREYGIKNVVVPQDGSVVQLSGGKPKLIDQVKTGVLAVDGGRLLPIDGAVYKQRILLSSSGVVSAVVKSGNGFISLLDLTCSGLFEEYERVELSDIKKDISSEIKLSLENMMRGKSNGKDVKISVEKIIRNMFLDTTGKKPVVLVHVING
jgi:ribonuclease J